MVNWVEHEKKFYNLGARIWNNGSDQIQRWKSPFQKLRDERVN